MEKLILLAGIALLIMAIRCHTMTHVHTKIRVERAWYDRLFTGSRPAKDNLTEEGLQFRRQSNMYAIAGFVSVGIYVFLRTN